jgi:hypothetical protein
LFQNFDDTFLSLWNLSSANSMTSAQSLIQLQDTLQFALPDVSDRTEIQQADLLVSRQWLKTMVWQLCVTKGLLSSFTANESMSFQYPVTIARDVVLVSRLLPAKAFEAHGVGILEKVFDIACSLADVLQLYPSSMQVAGLLVGPRDYLMELMMILGTVLGGSSRYARLLAAKVDECLQVRIRGSLSESQSSNDMNVVDDIDDENKNFEDKNNSARPCGTSTGDDAQALEVVEFPRANGSSEASYNLDGISRTNMANELQMPLSLSASPGTGP